MTAPYIPMPPGSTDLGPLAMLLHSMGRDALSALDDARVALFSMTPDELANPVVRGHLAQMGIDAGTLKPTASSANVRGAAKRTVGRAASMAMGAGATALLRRAVFGGLLGDAVLAGKGARAARAGARAGAEAMEIPTNIRGGTPLPTPAMGTGDVWLKLLQNMGPPR